MLWYIVLPLMNSFYKTEVAIFPMQTMLSDYFPFFLRLIEVCIFRVVLIRKDLLFTPLTDSEYKHMYQIHSGGKCKAFILYFDTLVWTRLSKIDPKCIIRNSYLKGN